MSTSLATSLKRRRHVRLHHDAAGVHRLDDAVAAGHAGHAGVAGDDRLDAGAHERRGGAQQRHRLALHVRAHERAVRVVVLEERDERGGHRHQLVRGHVHQVHVLGACAWTNSPPRRLETSSLTNLPFLSDLGVRLGDGVLLLLERRVEGHVRR